MKTRLSLGLGAGAAAALATAALMAGAGSAQTPPTTLHLVSTSQKNAGFMPKGAPHQGDRLGFGDRITGDDTGFDRGVCTVVGKPQILCTIQVQLSKGTLTVQGMLPRARQQDAGGDHRRDRRLQRRARHRAGRPTTATARPTSTSRCCPEPGEEVGRRDGGASSLGRASPSSLSQRTSVTLPSAISRP